MGCLSVLFNLIWILAGGWETALGFLVVGVSCYVTIIGTPLGRQAFKMAAVARWVWMSLATSQPRGPDRATLPIPGEAHAPQLVLVQLPAKRYLARRLVWFWADCR